MNGSKINPNAQTLGQLINKTDFVYWFFSLSSDIINPSSTTPTDYSMFNTDPTYVSLPSNMGLYANWSRLPGIINMFIPQLSNANNSNISSFTIQSELANILGTIYDLFKNSIPYDQSTSSQQIITFAPRLTQTSYIANITTTTIPSVLSEISAYLDLYINHINQYIILSYKYFVEGNILSSGLTNAKNETENEGNTGQTSGYNGTSFNPVSSAFTPNVSPIPINSASASGNTLPQGSASKVTGDSPATNKQGIQLTSLNNLANAQVNSNGFAHNKTLNRTYSYLNINELANIGNTQTLTVLKPLIYKLSTLFGTLGNDNYPQTDNNGGFNIG